MPSTEFICPDQERISIEQCLTRGGCRMPERCANLPYLRFIAYDREWRGITPSSAGNGPLLIALKKEKPYAISPDSRTFAVLGTGVHGKLGLDAYSFDVISEELITDIDGMKGTPDCFEPDENQEGCAELVDYKTYGSYKVAKLIGIVATEKPLLDADGKPYIWFKSGPRKGQPKTETIFTRDPERAETRDVELQLNRYRIMFSHKNPTPISRLKLIVYVRDGGTQVAKSRGIDRNLYVIPVNFLPDEEVLGYYQNLTREVDEILAHNFTRYGRLCNAWECWDGRRCQGFCEVSDYCKEITNRPDNWKGK